MAKLTQAGEAARPTAMAATAPPRRLLLVTNSVVMGGMEKHVELLARELPREQFEVFAICPDWEPTQGLAAALGEAADHLATITPDRRHGFFRLAREVGRFARQVRAWRIEVMHLHSTTFRGQLWATLAARLGGVRRIYVTEHLAPDAPVPMAERWLRDAYTRWLVDGIVCVSPKNYAARRRHLYTPAERTTVVNNGVDLAEFALPPTATLVALRRELGLPEGTPIVGTAIRFEPEKGLEYLVTAMPQILAARPDTRFLMVGDGSLRAGLEAMVAALGLSEVVHFVGFQRDPRPYIALMDAFVLPVPVGSMSIALLEAMALERAVVITFGGEGEAVVDGESGLWAAPRDPSSLAAAVVKIVTDPAYAADLGRAARRRVEEEFSAQQAARHLGDLYARS